MDLESAINRIKYYVFVEMGWSKNQLAQKADVPFNVVAKIHKEDWNPTLQRLKDIEKVVPSDFSLASLTGISTPTQPKESDQCPKTLKTTKPTLKTKSQ